MNNAAYHPPLSTKSSPFYVLTCSALQASYFDDGKRARWSPPTSAWRNATSQATLRGHAEPMATALCGSGSNRLRPQSAIGSDQCKWFTPYWLAQPPHQSVIGSHNPPIRHRGIMSSCFFIGCSRRTGACCRTVGSPLRVGGGWTAFGTTSTATSASTCCDSVDRRPPCPW